MKYVKKYTIVFIVLLVSLYAFAITSYAGTSGTYAYNDIVIVDQNNNEIFSGELRSNNPSLSSFTIWYNEDNNQWNMTDGNWTSFPCPSGKLPAITSSNSYITVNGNNIYPQRVSQTNTWAFYNIPASPYYPILVIHIYYNSSGDSGAVPYTPTLALNGNILSWSPTGYSAKILYSQDGAIYNTLADNVTGSTYTIQDYGYYRVQLYYTSSGETLITDTSNRIEYTANSGSTDNDNKTFFDRLSDIIDGLTNATQTIKGFIQSIGQLFTAIYEWLPPSVLTVFIAVIIIGLIMGLFIK